MSFKELVHVIRVNRFIGITFSLIFYHFNAHAYTDALSLIPETDKL